MLTFAAGAARRAIAAAAIIIAAVCALLLVEHLDERVGPPSTLRIEATTPVASWSVRIDGRELAADATTATSWTGSVPQSARAIAVAANASDRSAAFALRARLSGATGPADDSAQLAWGDGQAALVIEAGPPRGHHHD